MAILKRPKTQRRLLVLVTAIALFGGLIYGILVVRGRQIRRHQYEVRSEGMTAFKSRDWHTAVDRLREFVKWKGDDVDALFALAMARENDVDTEGRHVTEAIAYWRRYTELVPDNVESQHHLLSLECDAYMWDQVIDLSNRALARNDKDTAGLKALSTALAAGGRYREALAPADKYNNLVPTDLEGQTRTYMILRQLKTPLKKMMERAAKFEAEFPNDPRFKLAEVIAYAYGQDPTQDALPDEQRQEKKEQDLLLAVTGPKVDPPDAQFVSQAVGLLDKTHHFAEAQSLLERAAARIDDPSVRLMYVQRLYQNQQYGEVAARLADVTPDAARTANASMVAYKALSLHELDNKSAEADALVAALSARANDAEATAWSLGLNTTFHPEAKDAAQRFQDLIHAIEADRNNGVLRYMLAQEYQKAGESDLAMEEGRRAADNLPSWAAPHLFMAMALAQRHNLVGAYREVNTAVDASRGTSGKHAADPRVLQDQIVYESAERTHNIAQMNTLLTELEDLRKTLPDEPRTTAMYVRLLSQTGQSDKAKVVIKAEIANPPKDGGQAVLMNLAAVSRGERLGLDEQLLTAAEQKFGLSPALAMQRADEMVVSAGKPPAEAIAYLQDAARHGSGEAWEWEQVGCLFREAYKDPGAKAAWEAFGNAHPDNINVQNTILNNEVAGSVWAHDLPFISATIDRAKAKTGDTALGWRLAKARYLLARKQPDDAKDASFLLSEILDPKHDDAANEVEPHVLQSQALERLGNLEGAISEMSRASALAPNLPEVAYGLVRLNHNAGHYEEACQAFDSLAKVPSLPPQMAYNAAAMMFKEHELYRAQLVLESFYNSDEPAHRTAAITGLLAMTYENQGNRVKEAGELYLKLLDAKGVGSNIIEAAANFFGVWGPVSTARKFLAKLDETPLKPGEKELVLAEFEERFGDAAVADKEYADAVHASPSDPDPAARYIGFLVRQKRLDDASRTVDAALQTWPADADLKSLKAMTAAMTSAPYAGQLAAMAPLLTQDPGNPAVAATLSAMADAQTLSSADAAARYQAALKKYPNFYPLYELAVRRLITDLRSQSQDAALQLAARAMAKFTDQPASAQLNATALAEAGHWSEALEAAQTWRDRVPQRPLEPDYLYAVCQISLGQPGLAATELEPYVIDAKAKPEVPINRQVVRAYAQALLLTRRTDDAQALLQPLVKDSSEWRGVWLTLAKDAFRKGDDAAAWIAKVVPLIPKDNADENRRLGEAWFGVATHLSFQRAYENCRDVLKPLADKGALDQDGLLMLAMAEGEANDPGAADAYRGVISGAGAKDTNQAATARNNLANLLMAKGDPASLAEAEPLAKQAAEAADIDPGARPYYYDTLAHIYLKEGKPEQAVEQFRKADEMLKYDPIILIGWADALVRAHRVDRAVVKYQEVQQYLPPGARLSPELQQELDSVRDAVRRPVRSSVTNTETTPAAARP